MKTYSIKDPNTGTVGTLRPTSYHDAPDEFIPELKNGALVFRGDSELSFVDDVGDAPSRTYAARVYLGYAEGTYSRGTVLSVGALSLKLAPYDGASVASSVAAHVDAGSALIDPAAKYVLYVEDATGEYFIDRTIDNFTWANIAVRVSGDQASFILNDLKQELVGLSSPSPQDSIPCSLTGSIDVVWCSSMFGQGDDFRASDIGGQVVSPYDYFIDLPYLSYYTLRTCSESCPSASESPAGYNVPTKACTFVPGDESPVWDESYVQTIVGENTTVVVPETASGSSRTFYWQQLGDAASNPLQSKAVFVTEADGTSVEIFDSPDSNEPIAGSTVTTTTDGVFSFWCDDSKLVTMKVYSLNVNVMSSVFECDWYSDTGSTYSQCDPLIPLLAVKTRSTVGGVADSSGMCTLSSDGTTECSYCPLTTLNSIQVDYPKDSSIDAETILSTHYKVDISLNEEPLSGDEIISQALAKNAYTLFEEARPVTRVAHYHLNLEHAADFSGNPIPLYDDYYNYTATWVSRYAKSVELIPGGETSQFGGDSITGASTEWIITHNLNSAQIMCQCYDENGMLVYPSRQLPLDSNNYRVEWPEKMSGTALVCIANYYEEVDDSKLGWMIKHGLSIYESPMVVQVFEPETIDREEPASVSSDPDGFASIGVGEDQVAGAVGFASVDETFEFFGQSTWVVEHSLDSTGVMVQLYDSDWNAMVAENVHISSASRIVIDLGEQMSGYVGLKKIGNPTWKDDAVSSLVTVDGVADGKIVVSDLTALDSIDMLHGARYSDRTYDPDVDGEKTMQGSVFFEAPLSRVYEDSDNYYMEASFGAYDFEDMNINEMAVYTSAGEMIVYSVGSAVFKPTEMHLDVKYMVSKKDLNTLFV